MNHINSTKKLIIGLVAGAVLLAACGGDADPAGASETTATPATATTPTSAAPTSSLVPLETPPPAPVPQTYEDFRAQPTACGAEQPPEITPQEFAAPDDLILDPAVKLIATISTSCGPIIVELDPGMAPETVNSFVFLARQGYFDGTISHRIIPGFVIQAGDPTATGLGGPGYVIPDELPPDGFSYTTGVLAMANAGPNSTGSQFFIMVGDSGLPPLYSAYGVVTEGVETLTSIINLPLGTSPRGETSVPLETLYIESITVEPAS